MKAIAALSFLFFVTSATAAPFYQENFNFDSFSVPQNDALTQAGWKAFIPARPVRAFGNLKVATGIARNAACYNSFPSGPEDGYSLWSKITDGLTVFTEELSFSLSSLDTVSYLQRLTGSAPEIVPYDGTRLALKIRSADNSEQWYLSDDVMRQKKWGAWEEVTFSPHAITYAIAGSAASVGPAVPAAGNSGNFLPDNGIVTGFGVFVDRVNGRVRLDNFTLSDNLSSNGIDPQPTPTRRPGIQPTIGNPDPDPDPETTPTPISTVVASPTATPTKPAGITGSFKFCTVSKRSTRRIRLSSSAVRTVLGKLKGTSAKARRNRVIVEIVLKRKVIPASLENVRVSDFYSVGKACYLNVYGTERRPVRISRTLAKRISNYLHAAKIASQPQSPLFRVFTGKDVVTTSAACRTELNRLVTRALKRARG